MLYSSCCEVMNELDTWLDEVFLSDGDYTSYTFDSRVLLNKRPGDLPGSTNISCSETLISSLAVRGEV